MTALTDQHGFAEYERRLRRARTAFANRPAISLLENGGAANQQMLHRFLICFALYGTSMTRPVEHWIRLAGAECETAGFEKLGKRLQQHAAHDAGHHQLRVADFWALIEDWNRRNQTPIDAVGLSQSKPLPAAAAYRDLHERTIAGTTPYAQIAIEYEIEALSVRHGTNLLAAANSFGATGIAGGLSFLREHVTVDAAHTEFNRREIDALLKTHPACLPSLVEAGGAALSIYGDFIEQWLQAALRLEAHEGTLQLTPKFYEAPETEGPVPEWLLWVRSIRSQILHDGGKRVAFGPGGECYGDADPEDFECRHLVLYDGEMPVGAARLSPPADDRTHSFVRTVFSPVEIRRAARELAIVPSRCAEASRLVLHPSYRRGNSVRLILAGLWAMAAATGADGILAAVGTGNGQDRLFRLYGDCFPSGISRARVSAFQDTVQLAYFPVDPEKPPEYPELDHMREFCARTSAGNQQPLAA